MVNTCVSSQPNDTVQFLSIFSLINPACFLGLALLRFYVYMVEYVDQPRALNMIKSLLGLGMANTLSNSILFFVFYSIPGNSAMEFACQSQSSTLGIIFPIIFIGVSCLIIFTSFLRAVLVRYQYATLATNAGAFDGLSTTGKNAVLLCIGCNRGTFVTPLVREMKSKLASDQQLHVIGVDAFNTLLYPESNEWLQSNMTVEGVFKFKKTYSSTVPGDENFLATSFTVMRTDYSSGIAIPSNSVDVISMPMGVAMTYLTLEENPALKEEKAIALFNEMFRILKPNGKLILSNMLIMNELFNTSFKKSLFNGKMRTFGKFLFWSFIPAKFSISEKSAESHQSVQMNSGAQGDGGHIGYFGPNSAELDNFTHIDSATGSKFVSEDALKLYTWFPAGSHWRLVDFLCIFTLTLWIGFVILTWQVLLYLQVPYFLPYSMLVAALFINNANILPFVIYLILARLRTNTLAAEKEIPELIEADTRRRSSMVENNSGFSDNSTPVVYTRNTEKFEVLMRNRILKNYRAEMFDVLLLLSLNSGLGWFPYFILDVILIKGFNGSSAMVKSINTITGIAITIFFIAFSKRLSAWYSRIKAKQAADQDLDTRETIIGDVSTATSASKSNRSIGGASPATNEQEFEMQRGNSHVLSATRAPNTTSPMHEI